MEKYLTFRLGSRRYAVNVGYVNSILEVQPSTPLSLTKGMVRSLTNVRGIVVPLFSPDAFLEKTAVDSGDSSADTYDDDEKGIIVFECGNGTMLPFIGLHSDGIGKVVLLDKKDIASVPSFLPESASRLFEGFLFIKEKRHSIIALPELVNHDTLFGSAVEDGIAAGGLHE
jgi:chemotaxis signal transduction protein